MQKRANIHSNNGKNTLHLLTKSQKIERCPTFPPFESPFKPNSLAVTRVLSTVHPKKETRKKKLGRLYLMTIGDAQKTRHPPENAVEQHLHHSAAAPQVRRRQIPVSPTPSVPSVAQNQAAGSKDRVDEEQKMKRHHRGEVDPSPLAHTPTADGRPEPEKRRKGAPARHRKVGSDLMEEEEEEMSTSETTLQSAPPNLPHAPEPPPPPAPQSSAATPD